jgi:TolA-binding protein
MSENNDVLQRAARALRETHSGDSARSPFTRARVMRSLHEDKKRRLSRTLIFGPLAAILVGSTAWAAATGQLPVLFERAEQWFVSAQAPTGQATAIPQPGRKHTAKHSPSSEEPLAVEAAPSVDPVPTVEAVPTVAPTIEVVESPPERVVARRRLAEPAVVSEPPRAEPVPEPPPAPEVPPELARDPELAQFRRAHDLHFQGKANAAIAAYGEYLGAYPGGRFVPEARYNTALNLLKLGQRSRAQSILKAFAEGRYGGYRQEQARGLLDAMAAGGASSRD